MIPRPTTTNDGRSVVKRGGVDKGAQHREEYESHDLMCATYSYVGRLAQYESPWVIQRLIDSKNGNLVPLGREIVVSTAASIWSLCI